MTMKIMLMTIPVSEIPDVFEDMTPIPWDEKNCGVCEIEYSSSVRWAYGYFLQACLTKQERSMRCLQLSATCLQLNMANYSVWSYRRSCIRELFFLGKKHLKEAQSFVSQELDFVAQLAGNNPKNYQVWYHRRAILDALFQMDEQQVQESTSTTTTTTATTSTTSTSSFRYDLFQQERKYLNQVLEEDAKNYHAWSHRQWLFKTIKDPKLFEEELDYVHGLIEKDPRNNSAWNQRWFAVHQGGLSESPLSLPGCQREVDFALQAGAAKDPYNESPFRYLIGFIREQKNTATTVVLAKGILPRVEALEQVLLDHHRDPNQCVNWISAKIDLLQEIMEDGNTAEKESTISLAIQLAQGLGLGPDQIRSKYWNWRIEQWQKKLP